MKNWPSHRFSLIAATALVTLVAIILAYREAEKRRNEETNLTLVSEKSNRESKLNRTRESRSQAIPETIQSLESLLLDTPTGTKQRELIYQLATAYAREDPEGGIQWLATLPQVLENRIVFTVFASTLALSNPDKAKELFRSVDSAYGKQAYFNGVITARGKIDPRGTWEFYLKSREELPDPKQAMGTALSEMRDDDLTTWQNLQSIAEGDKDLLAYFENFQLSSLDTGFELIESIEGSDYKSKAIKGLVKKWPADRLDEIATYARSQEPSAQNDSLFEALVEKTYTTDPVKASEWIKYFSNEKTKNASSTLILNYAQSQDPAMAKRIKILIQDDPS
jgi:hypothetical protein